MAELKPCPFCGGKASKITSRRGGDLADLSRIFCGNVLCPVQPATRRRRTMEEAIEDWEKRPENEELKFTREFIHEHGLEFALASAWNRRAEDGK